MLKFHGGGLSAVAVVLLFFCVPGKAVINGHLLSGPENRWIVALETYQIVDNNLQSSSCSGSLVDHQWVLTAEHCVPPGSITRVHIIDYPLDSPVFAGISDPEAFIAEFTRSPLFHPDLEDHILESVDVSHSYSLPGVDMALLKLERPTTQAPTLGSIVSPTKGQDLRSGSLRGIPFVVAGLGRTGLDGTHFHHSGLMRLYYYTNLLLPRFPDLRHSWGQKVRYQTTPSTYGKVQRIATFGDSGAPLMALYEGAWQIIGVFVSVEFPARSRDDNRRLHTPRKSYTEIVDLHMCSILDRIPEGERPDFYNCSQPNSKEDL